MSRESLAGSPVAVDRILVVTCTVIWLAALGAGVAAAVALVDLGSGHSRGTGGDSATPWLLYGIIAVSALIIVGAVPLLVRARRAALAEPAAPTPALSPAELPTPATRQAAPSPVEAATEKLRILGPVADPWDHDDPPGYPGPMPARFSANIIPAAALDRIWLRCGVAIFTAIGTATICIAIGTYLMAVESDGAALAAYIVAGVITVGMPVIPWLFLRQLRAALDAAADIE